MSDPIDPIEVLERCAAFYDGGFVPAKAVILAAIATLKAREAARRLAVKACEEVSKHWMCLDSAEKALAANAAAEAGREP